MSDSMFPRPPRRMRQPSKDMLREHLAWAATDIEKLRAAGWDCTRGYGHDGPCAATPHHGGDAVAQVAAVRAWCDEQDASARAEGFGGGSARARELREVLDRAAIAIPALADDGEVGRGG